MTPSRIFFSLAIGLLAFRSWHAVELGHSAQSTWTVANTLVVRDVAALRSAWTQMYPSAAMRPALPRVDFGKYRVLVIASGTRPTGGYRLMLESARMAQDTALVTVTMLTPPKGCGVMQELTAPALAIAVPVAPTAFRVIAHERADTVRCH